MDLVISVSRNKYCHQIYGLKVNENISSNVSIRRRMSSINATGECCRYDLVLPSVVLPKIFHFNRVKTQLLQLLSTWTSRTHPLPQFTPISSHSVILQCAAYMSHLIQHNYSQKYPSWLHSVSYGGCSHEPLQPTHSLTRCQHSHCCTLTLFIAVLSKDKTNNGICRVRHGRTDRHPQKTAFAPPQTKNPNPNFFATPTCSPPPEGEITPTT